MKRVINILMLTLLMFSTVSCDNSSQSGTGQAGAQKGETNLALKETYKGTHQINYVKTDKMLTSNGSSEYVILIPDDYSKTLYSAASELRLIINYASGCSIEIVTESEYSEGKFISLGYTENFNNSITEDISYLGSNGYIIKTIEENIYINSNQDCGILNGVYGLLEVTVDFSVYAADEVVYTTGDVPLYNYDIIDIPDIQYRVGDVTTKIDGDNAYRMRLKYNCNADVFSFVKGSLYHNSLHYFPKDQYSDEYYRDWYSESNGTTNYQNLCYSSHGNAEKQDLMIEKAVELIVDTVKDTDALNVTFQQSDIPTWCECETCKAAKKKYGTDSAILIQFLNKMSVKLKEGLAANGMADKKINICFFAYQKTEMPPVKQNADGTYSPIDDSVILEDNICVFYAPIYASYNSSFEEGDNKVYAEALKAWNAIADKTFVWFYQTNFSHYLYPYNTLPTMQERYNFIALQGAEFIFDQNQWDQGTKTSFHRLKAWMSAKLSWNVNLNYEELLDEYFAGYFYEAKDAMRQYFDELTYHMEYLERESEMAGTIYYQINQHKYFPKPMLDGWLELIDEAYKSIEIYKTTNKELYDKLYTRIAIEEMSVRYMVIDLYAGRFSPIELRELQIAFMNDCFKYGIDKIAEIKDISVVFSQWGIL